MVQEKKVLSTIEQVLLVMDGRSQRMFSMEVRIPEAEFSRKLKGRIPFSQVEIDRINARWGSNVVRIIEISTENNLAQAG